MRQVAIRPPEREHAPEYELVQREEASELRRRARAAFFAERTEDDERDARRPHKRLPPAGPADVIEKDTWVYSTWHAHFSVAGWASVGDRLTTFSLSRGDGA